jgi:hypothetical protein
MGDAASREFRNAREAGREDQSRRGEGNFKLSAIRKRSFAIAPALESWLIAGSKILDNDRSLLIEGRSGEGYGLS